jgi:hypothetical protein
LKIDNTNLPLSLRSAPGTGVYIDMGRLCQQPHTQAASTRWRLRLRWNVFE